jgi:acetolactate synthase-1/2/3 large subunit
MLREYVKWDYELRTPAQLEAVLGRALALSKGEPPGPVYLTLPREVLAAPWPEGALAPSGGEGALAPPHPDPQALAEAARILAHAERPLVITSSLGRSPRAVEALGTLARRFALPVVSFRPRYLNLPADHPMHLGFEPGPTLEQADAVLVVECDVPWIPSRQGPPADCPVIHVGADPLFARYPVRSFPWRLAITATAEAALPALAEALAAHEQATAGLIQARRERTARVRQTLEAVWARALEQSQRQAPLSPVWASRCLAEAVGTEGILVNEYPLSTEQLGQSRPGSFFGSSPAGCLGWGLGAALGAKLAAPDRVVAAALGDGSYLLGNPIPCHFVARAQGLPILTVVFNNAMWGAVKRATLAMYPEGHAARSDRMPLTHLDPPPDYELLVQSCGGHGERVERPEHLEPALQRALRIVREEKRQALLNVICAPA